MIEHKIKVLIVDDSFFMRRLISDILKDDSQIEIIGEAKNGIEAIKQVDALEPDVVTMDFNMPKLNGAAATEKILERTGKRPAIIIVSGHSQKDVKQALNGLRLGAVDFIAKPSGELSVDIKNIGDELIRKIKIASRARVQQYRQAIKKKAQKAAKRGRAAKVIVIGASTGGPPVVENIVAGFPSCLKAAILVVQHMSELFVPGLVKLMDSHATVKVELAAEGVEIRNETCLVSPGGQHMLAELKEEESGAVNKIIHLTKEPKVNGFRPSINVLMRSVARRFGNKAIGVLLTGMGDDGAEGMKAIKAAGGYTIAQSLDTTVVGSMPRAAIEAGAVDEILPPAEIASKIIELCK